MHTLAPAARVYVLAVSALGSLVLGLTVSPLVIRRPAEFLALLLLGILASVIKFTVPLPRSLAAAPLTMSLAFAVNFAALLVLGGDNAAIIAVVAAWSQTTFNARARNPWYRTVFNMAALAITMRAADVVFLRLGGVYGAWSLPSQFVAVAGSAIAYFLVNSGLIAGAVSLTTQQPFFRTWHQNFAHGWIGHLFGSGVAALAAVVVGHTGYWLTPLVVLTLFLAYRAYQTYIARIDEQHRAVQTLSDLHLATVEALALAIDAKDHGSRLHLRRLQRHSVALARALGLDDEHQQAISTAAMLHDIGMLAVPQHILAKGDGLTDDERRKLWLHPQIGADIVRSVPFPAPVSPLILGHHERWDGQGYPSGLAGEQIPLGSRILALVDHFDALMSANPGLTAAAAVQRLSKEGGRALDPALVERFSGMLPEVVRLEAELGTSLEEADQPAPRRGGPIGQPAGPLEHIALAHREVYELYHLSQALGATLTVADAMEQLRGHLATLVPFTTSALFLNDRETGLTACRWIGGWDPEAVTSIANEFVEGPVAWVLENGRSLITALPGALVSSGLEGTPARATAVVEVLLCPLSAGGRPFGVLAAYHDRRGTYGDDHRRVFERIAQIVSAAIQNALRYERTHEAALTDRLTGLANRRGLSAGFDRAVARASHDQQPLAVLMVDVDRFKSINDTYGHDVGDRALKAVSRVIFHSIRPNDLCARYAGDEFVVVLANCDAALADRRATEIRREIAELHFEPTPGLATGLRISVGSAVYPRDGRTLDELLVVADRRMYVDKTANKQAPEVERPHPGGPANRRTTLLIRD
jgi:diguanylate cyclase (GGDEF)-like protein